MTKHPLDAVASALVDASNALQDVDEFSGLDYAHVDEAIDAALRLVQMIIRNDIDPPDPRD